MTPNPNDPPGASSRRRVPLKRRALLDAALALMGEHTFAGARVPDIARRARVAAGSLYRYFPSKEALGNALYRECAGAQAAFLTRALEVEAAPRQQFTRLWQALFEFARSQPEAATFLEAHHHGGYLDAESRRAAGRVEGLLRDFVERAQAEGALPPGDPELRVALLRGAFAGLVRARDAGTVTLDEARCHASRRAVWALLRA